MIEEEVIAALKSLGKKPETAEQRESKQNFSQRLSNAMAQAFAAELRRRGMKGARPAEPGELGGSGAERRMSGGIGAKKVDVTWATEESGLICAVSIKSISFSDAKTKNFQKNLTNRRGDMLFEAVTLHRRFPFAVLAGVFMLDKGAAEDQTDRRKSTVENAHEKLKLFTGRKDPWGQEEVFERLFIMLFDASPFAPSYQLYRVGETANPVTLPDVVDELVRLVVERNSDFYNEKDGNIVRGAGRNFRQL